MINRYKVAVSSKPKRFLRPNNTFVRRYNTLFLIGRKSKTENDLQKFFQPGRETTAIS